MSPYWALEEDTKDSAAIRPTNLGRRAALWHLVLRRERHITRQRDLKLGRLPWPVRDICKGRGRGDSKCERVSTCHCGTWRWRKEGEANEGSFRRWGSLGRTQEGKRGLGLATPKTWILPTTRISHPSKLQKKMQFCRHPDVSRVRAMLEFWPTGLQK